MSSKTPIHVSSGNVFEDLGLSDAEDLCIQAELARLIHLRIKELGLTQAQAGRMLGLRQPDVSRLMNGKHSGFSAERLFRLLNALDQDVQIVVRNKPPRARRQARISVVTS